MGTVNIIRARASIALWIAVSVAVAVVVALALPAGVPATSEDERPGQGASQRAQERRFQAKHVRVVGYTELEGRGPGAFKLSIQEVGGRWLLYMGHLWHRGWSIVDVTDPKKPELVNAIDGPDNTWTIQMEIADGKMITALQSLPPAWGGDPLRPFSEGVLIWDIEADPTDPQLLGHYETGGSGTHRNHYDGGRYVHLSAGVPEMSGNIYVIIDIDDPANPVEVGRWFFEEQATGEAEFGLSLHGPPYVLDDVAYLPYGSRGVVILDVSDVTDPQLISQLDFTPPFLGAPIGMHSALPLPDRDLLLLASEAIRERCDEPLNHVSLVDISDLGDPTLVSVFPVPEPPPSVRYDDFCEKGARFGPHNFNMLHHNEFVDQSDQLVYQAYFNAGLRIFDISNERLPQEVGYFIPPDPTTRFGPVPSELALQSEEVLVDSRGYIYLTNKNQGLWILEYTGPHGRR